MSPGENTSLFHIIHGSFSILIMFYRKITFSDAVKSYRELPAPTYSPSVTDLEMIQRIHVMSHAWRESDQALQEATIIHREFMLETSPHEQYFFFLGFKTWTTSPIWGTA